MVIDAQTMLVGVMGWPIAHSLSPAMHNAAFDVLGLNWRYVAFPVRPGQVGTAVEGLKALNLRGCNVTLPHKEAVIPFLDHIPERVRRFSAVNTLVIERDQDGRATVSGDNTDVPGFILPLQQRGLEPQGKRVLVVGAGGVARGASYSLCQAGVAEITVLNRTAARADALIQDMAASAHETRLRADALTRDTLIAYARRSDVLINATSKGMWPDVNASIWPDDILVPSHLIVYDLVYRPLETKLLRQARQAHAEAVDGLDMFIAQGALSFQMWTDQWPPEEAMRKACEQILMRET